MSQRIGAAAAAESKEDAADAGATVHAQQDCVDTWSTDKIETFAPAAEQMIVGRASNDLRRAIAHIRRADEQVIPAEQVISAPLWVIPCRCR